MTERIEDRASAGRSIGEAPMSDTSGRGAGVAGMGRAPGSTATTADSYGIDLQHWEAVRDRIEQEVRAKPVRSTLIALGIGFVLGKIIR